MAYFPNGTSAEKFSNQCATCRLADEMCPIAFVQLQHNYEAVSNPTATSILAALVDDIAGCRMWPLINVVREPCACCDQPATHRDDSGFARCAACAISGPERQL